MQSYGDEIAASLASKLGWPLIERKRILDEYLSEIANPFELKMLGESAKYCLNDSGRDGSYLEYIEAKLAEISHKQSIIVMGFGSQMMFPGEDDTLHFRIVADEQTRQKRVKKQYNLSDEEAENIIKKSDRKRKKFVQTLYGADVTDSSLYHAVLNTSILTAEECVSAIIAMIDTRIARVERLLKDADTNIMNNESDVHVLKTESEKEFAKILDMYHIDWVYEPKTFPMEWDEEGNITSAFSPDFYLTKFDTYIELTTMNQKYVTEKNRKIKKLKKLYPGINIKIVYKKDFYSLVERFKAFGGEE